MKPKYTYLENCDIMWCKPLMVYYHYGEGYLFVTGKYICGSRVSELFVIMMHGYAAHK